MGVGALSIVPDQSSVRVAVRIGKDRPIAKFLPILLDPKKSGEEGIPGLTVRELFVDGATPDTETEDLFSAVQNSGGSMSPRATEGIAVFETRADGVTREQLVAVLDRIGFTILDLQIE